MSSHDHTSKTCATCKFAKPLTEFPPHRVGVLGRLSQCRACKAAKQRARYAEHGVAIKQVRQQQRDARVAENGVCHNRNYYQAYYQANSERLRAASREYKRANPGKVARHGAERRKYIRQATPRWADIQAIELIYEQMNLRRKQGEDVQVDHIIPIRGKHVCGLHVENNLQIIPRLDNVRKSNRLIPY